MLQNASGVMFAPVGFAALPVAVQQAAAAPDAAGVKLVHTQLSAPHKQQSPKQFSSRAHTFSACQKVKRAILCSVKAPLAISGAAWQRLQHLVGELGMRLHLAVIHGSLAEPATPCAAMSAALDCDSSNAAPL